MKTVTVSLLAIFVLSISGPSEAQRTTRINRCGTLAGPGHYFLARDIVSSSGGTCIEIPGTATTGGDIVIDLMGHRIEGVFGIGGVAIDRAPGVNLDAHVTIRNGIIRRFDNGIDAACCGTTVIENMVIEGITVTAIDVNDGIVKNNVITGAFIGIQCGGRCVVSDNVLTEMGGISPSGFGINSNGVITRNVVQRIAGSPEFLGIDGFGASVSHNHIEAFIGIENARIAHHNVVVSTSSDVGSIGIDMNCPGVVTSNVILGPALTKIDAIGCVNSDNSF